MKKFLAFATLASVALVGCVNDEKMEMTSGAQKISFDTPVMSTQTRADYLGEIVGTSYPIEEDFAVYAKQHSGAFDGWEEGTEDFWSGPQTVDYSAALDNNNGAWATSTDYYWPEKPYQLTFAAYSPADCSGTKSYGATGLIIKDFESLGQFGQQYDLMYSNRSTNNNEAANASTGAEIQFNHALSSIVFAAVDADNTASYKITSLTLTSTTWANKGTFKQNITEIPATADAEYAESSNPSWENITTGGVNYTIYTGAYTVLDAQNPFTGNGTDAGLTTAVLTIPQDVPSDAKVTIVYDKTPTNGSVQTGISAEAYLKDFLTDVDDDSSKIQSWVRNGRYTYVFSFGQGKKIFFKPAVTDWENKDAAFITID